MLTGFSKQFLYSAFQLKLQFTEFGNAKEATGTGFIFMIERELFLVTNRHVVDPAFKNRQYQDWKLDRIDARGRFSGDDLTTMCVSVDVDLCGSRRAA
jgi:hypothetical protein